MFFNLIVCCNFRRLPVAAIVEETFAKCVDWFVKRRERAVGLQLQGQLFSTRVHKKMDKHIRKTQKMSAVTFGRNEWQVTSHGEKIPYDMQRDSLSQMERDATYRVVLQDNNRMECTCQKPQLSGIPCVHVMSVCRLRYQSLIIIS
jgi:SWIM zinc finger